VSTPTLVILSAPEDAPFVARLAGDLSAAGYAIADIADERLHEDPGTEPSELRRRLEPAHAVLVVLSPAASQSPQVRCEIEFARLLDPAAASPRLVPVLVSAADVPHSLKNLHTIYFTAGPYEAALARLKDHLSAQRDDQSGKWPSVSVAPEISVAPTVPLGEALAPAQSAPIVTLAPPPSATPLAATQAASVTSASGASPATTVNATPSMPAARPVPTSERKRRPLWKALFRRG
jgi:hypothetical protein